MQGERGPGTPLPAARGDPPSQRGPSSRGSAPQDPSPQDLSPEKQRGGASPGRSDECHLDRLLEDYLSRLRRGEKPTIEEYAAAHPELAGDIRDLFPALSAMEEIKGSSAAEDAPPERIGDFRIVREAGRGGMGVVYEAIQESLGRRVALKVLPRELLGDLKGLERFRREARAAARLHHTNIVPVFGVGEEKGIHYYAMQFIEGRSLDRILEEARRARGGGPPIFPSLGGSSKEVQATANDGRGSSGTNSPERRHHRAVARVGLQVAEALAYAHAQGILHRDIKPSNLLLDAVGTVWITDFGLAKGDETDALTQAGDIVGTIAYLAPERLEGKSDARSDVYALGLTLYEILTLRPAFADENRRRLLKRIAEESPPAPRALDPTIPRDLETIVLTAIAKDSARRYASAARLADDLRSFLAGRPIAARRASATEQLRRWCRREPALAALTSSVLLLLVTIATLSSFGYLKLRELLGVANTNLDRAQTAEGQARAELRRSYLAQARSIRIGGQPGRRFDCLDAVHRAVELGPLEAEVRALRDEAIAALSLADLRVTNRWRKDPRLAFAFAPDLESFAAADPNGKEIVLRRVADQTEIARLPVPGARYGSLHFSGDGRFLAARLEETRDRLAVVDLDSREKIYASPEATFGFGIDFHPQSKLLAVASVKRSVHIIDLSERREVSRYDVPPRTEAIAFHPSGERIALVSTGDGRIQVADARSGREIASIEDNVAHSSLSWSAEGFLLATGGADGSIGLWEFSGETLRQNRKLHKLSDGVMSIFFNHADTLLATYSWVEMLRVWDIDSGNLLLAADWRPLGFSSDDRKLALMLGNYEAGLAEVAESAVCRVIDPPPMVKAQVIRPQISPDGRLLACGRREAKFGIAVYDLEAERYLPAVPVPGGESALFSADGRWLITGGRYGLHRWPIERAGVENAASQEKEKDSQEAEKDAHGKAVDVDFRFGPPETLEQVQGDSSRWVSQSADGKTLAIIGQRDRAEVIVLSIDGRVRRQAILSPHFNVNRISLRPDGLRLASGTWQGTDVKVWNALSGQLELTIPLRDNAFVEFSPDGRWLAVMTPTDCLLYDAVTLELNRRIKKPARAGYHGIAAFRNDGKVLAISYGRNSVRLIDPSTGVDFATLEAPAPLGGGITFHPDGSRLYVGAEDGRVHVWDLKLLRRELRDLGLDWAEPDR